jgi:hypothetical protein
VSELAEKFSLARVLIGSVRSQEEAKISVTLTLVDAPGHRVIGSKSLLLTVDGTDADQVEADVTNAANKLLSQDAAPAAPAAEASRKPVMPGAVPNADDPGLVSRERKVAVPATTKEAAAAKEKESAAPAPKQETKPKKKDKPKGIQGKTGTEGWDED